MSVVILGGNERMEREYEELCRENGCKAKVYAKINGTLRGKIGSPDLLVMFTGTMSHKMAQGAMKECKGQNIMVARSHSSSLFALRGILDEYLPLLRGEM